MKYIITESQENRGILKYLNTEYGDLKPYKTYKYPNHIFFMKDGEVIFDYNEKNGVVHVSYTHFWLFLKSFFELNDKEIGDLTKALVEEHYKLEVTTTIIDTIGILTRWRNNTN
jgi:hypothetical protein